MARTISSTTDRSYNHGTASGTGNDFFRRPGNPASFKPDQKISFWMQGYNLGVDGKTHRPSATVVYDVVSEATRKSMIHAEQATSQMGNVGDQIILQKTLTAADLPPDVYKLRITVKAQVSGQVVEPETRFAVE